MNRLALLSCLFVAGIASVACGDEADRPGSDQSDSGGSGRDVNATYQEIFNDLSVYPGARRIEHDPGNYAYPFADFSVPANPSSALSFYEKELPPLGWQALSGPTALPSKAEGQQQKAQTYLKGAFSLTVYAHDSPPKGEQPGNIQVTLRLQER